MCDVSLLMQSSKFLTVYRWCCTYSHNYPCASCFLWGTAQNAQGSIQFRYECVYSCTSTLGVNCSVLVYQVVTVEVFLVLSHSTSCSEHHQLSSLASLPSFFSFSIRLLSSYLFLPLFLSPSLSPPLNLCRALKIRAKDNFLSHC